MRFFIRLEEILTLGLVDDRVFMTLVLPLLPGGLLQLLGVCLRDGSSWAQCKSQVLEEYFPYFVRERLVRDLIVFNFHGRGQSLRMYIEQVFRAAEFLQYQSTEQQLVERVIMNFHPDILNQAAFLEKPRSRKELNRAVWLIEERFAVLRERDRLGQKTRGEGVSSEVDRGFALNPQGRPRVAGRNPAECWNCCQPGHVRNRCPRRNSLSGNGQRPGSRAAPRESASSRGVFLRCFRKIVAIPSEAPLWVMLELKRGKIPALVDTGAQFSCIRVDVAEYLYLMGEPCVFGSCSVRCVLADGTRCELKDVVKLRVKLIGYSWTHDFKVLIGGPFPVILGLDFMRRTSMRVEIAPRRFSFEFAPIVGEFGNRTEEVGDGQYLRNVAAQVSEENDSQGGRSNDLTVESFSAEFPTLFSSTLGTANCAPYEIELSDGTPVRSCPYRCAPPKMEIFRSMVNEVERGSAP